MSQSRLQKWAEPTYLLTLLTGDDEARLKQWSEMQKTASENWNEVEKPRFTNYGLIASCHELIFDVSEGKPIFHAITYSFDVSKIAIIVQHLFELLVGDQGTQAEIDEEIINTMALAAGLGIPVYPNTEDIAPVMAKYHRRMLVEGFTAPDRGGNKIRLKLKKSPGKRIDDPRYIKELDPTEHVSPADIFLIKDAVSSELTRLWHAERALSNLRHGIEELEELLKALRRNERKLQQCLTDNPALFGPDYVRVIPKHTLGSEYEMDYALERHSGLVDLVEIEASSLSLFTKSGDPSRYLTHAEQQVIDWIDWIERNSAYAREKLPGLMAPVGYVVIGSAKTMLNKDMERLRRRNAMFRGMLLILTYDQLLNRAKQILKYLEGPVAVSMPKRPLRRRLTKGHSAQG